MANIGESFITIKDRLNTLNPDETEAARGIIEILNKEDAIMRDMVFNEANGALYHRTTIRSGLPDAYWRSINQGVPHSKATTVQVDDRIAEVAAKCKIDRKLLMLNGGGAEFILSENRAFIESMGQAAVKELFYGDLANNPKGFLGLAHRYGSLSAANAKNIHDMGGTDPNNNTSLYYVTWGPDTAHMIYPQGTPAGLEQLTFTNERVEDRDGEWFPGNEYYYSWNLGFCLRDWRYCFRICNINTTNLNALVGTGAEDPAERTLSRALIKMINSVPTGGAGAGRNRAIYANETVLTALDIMASEKRNNNLYMDNWEGERVMFFRGVPLKKCESIANDEPVVT